MIQIIAFCLLALVSADPVPDFKDCGSVSGQIASLDITPCASFPCQFPRGKNVTVSIQINANSTVTTAKTIVHGIIAGILTPFPIPNSDACKNMACPVKSGSEATYNNVILVEEVYPKIALVVKWEVEDQLRRDFICFEVPAEIVD